MSVEIKLQMKCLVIMKLMIVIVRVMFVFCLMVVNARLIVFDALADSGNEGIEIISAGNRYKSIEDYKEVENRNNTDVQSGSQNLNLEEIVEPIVFSKIGNHISQLPFESIFQRRIRLDKENLLKLTLASQNSLLGQKLSGDSAVVYEQFLPAFIAMRKVGFNTVVERVIEDFQRNNGDVIYYKYLKSKDLESVLGQSFAGGDYQGPILLISDKKKLRIMTLESVPDESTANYSAQAR